MKTITAFVGSARKRGATYAATHQFLDNLEALGDVKGEIIFLSDYSLGVCRGCKRCFLRGEECCPLKDDRDVLIEKMMASDGVVLASPNYSFHVSALIKIFLDRLGFVFHRPQFHGKSFTNIVVQGIHGGGKIVRYLNFVGQGLGFNVVNGSCITALEPMSEKDRRKMEETLDKQSRQFYERLMKPAFAAPSLFQLMAFRMGRTSIKRMLGDDNRDYTHYRDRGWFDADYYFPVRLGAFKKAVGATFDWIADRMFRKKEAA